MQNLKTPVTVFEAEAQGLENETKTIVTQTKQDKPIILNVGGNIFKEAPIGEYVAKCTKIAVIARKLIVYFVVSEGVHTGKRARLFYNMMTQEESGRLNTNFGAKSKFYSDLKKLFPDNIGDGTMPIELNIRDLFYGKTFTIKVKRSDKEQAIVINIEHYVGF